MNNPVISGIIKPICWPCSSGVVCKGFLQGRVTAKQSPVTTRLWVLTYRLKGLVAWIFRGQGTGLIWEVLAFFWTQLHHTFLCISKQGE